MSVLDRIWENSELYQLIRGYPGGIIIFGLRGEILEVNPVFEELIGHPESTLYEKKYFDICAAEYNAEEAEIIENRAFREGFTPLYEKKYSLNGKSVLVRQVTYLLKDGNGTPICMLAMMSPDIPQTEHSTYNRTLENLKKQNAELSTALERAANPNVDGMKKKLEQLEATLGQAREDKERLARELVVRDKTIEWKDATIKQLKEEQHVLADKLRAAEGALDVASIMETEESSPKEAHLPAGPLPWDETAPAQDEDAADMEIPWPDDVDDVSEDEAKNAPFPVVPPSSDSERAQREEEIVRTSGIVSIDAPVGSPDGIDKKSIP